MALELLRRRILIVDHELDLFPRRNTQFRRLETMIADHQREFGIRAEREAGQQAQGEKQATHGGTPYITDNYNNDNHSHY